jgi:hypothetical protein
MEFTVRFPIAIRYGFPNQTGFSAVKVAKGAFYYITNCDAFLAAYTQKFPKERVFDVGDTETTQHDFEQNYLGGTHRWALRLVNQETGNKNYMELDLTVGVVGDLEGHDVWA